MAFLKIISPEGSERTVELIDHNTLGRHPDNTVQLLDRIVSKNHCHIDRSDSHYILVDQGSLNGTYVNGERVQGTRLLRPNDEITLGSTKVQFLNAIAEEPKPAPGVNPSNKTIAAANVSGRVTMSPGMVESHIRSKLSQQVSQNFQTERLIRDEATLRRDYEKLRELRADARDRR